MIGNEIHYSIEYSVEQVQERYATAFPLYISSSQLLGITDNTEGPRDIA